MTTPADKQHDLLDQPVPTLLIRLAVPVGVGFFFNTMFNVVDTFYAGLISTQAQAALSLSFPVFFLIIAVGSGISTASTSLIGHSLGSGRHEDAKLYAAQTLSFALIHGLLITLLGLGSAPAVLTMLGASGEYQQIAHSYVGTIFSGAGFFIANQSQNGILSATGDTRSFRNFLIAAFLLNLVYDPWFIYGGFGLPPLGVKGIAWATVFIQGMGTLYLFSRVLKTGMVTREAWRLVIPRFRPFRDLARQGLPSSLTMLTVAIGIFVITWFVGRFGKEAVAAYGIAARIEQMVLLPVMGLNVATLALVAQNSGAHRFGRVRETVKCALERGLFLIAFGAAAVFIGAEQLMALFTKDPGVVAIGTGYLRIAAFVFGAYVILYINSFALQGIKRPQVSLAIGTFRQIIAPLPVFWFLSLQMRWGLDGIWWGILFVNWAAALISLAIIRKTLNEL
jgi:putative MATE family efflux protein